MSLNKIERRGRIKLRIRKVVNGTAQKPRMSVFRSNRHISVQLIDDVNGVTLALVGKLAAERSVQKGISEVAFDRNGYLYHGRVKMLADAAREGGLKF